MHKEPRGSAGRVCVIHVNVGPEKAHGAQDLVRNVLPNIAGGYHWVFDNHDAIRCANDNEKVYGAKSGKGDVANATGLHYCIIGEATQTAAQWLDDYSQAAMALCAAQVASDCKAKNIQTIRTPGKYSGVCGHGDVSVAFGVRGGHTDPGPFFPWDYFLGLVRTLNLTMPTTAWPFGDDMPKPSDVMAVLENADGKWKLTADGGVQAVRGPFYGSYPGLPETARQGSRYFTAIGLNAGRPGYTLYANDGAEYSFPV